MKPNPPSLPVSLSPCLLVRLSPGHRLAALALILLSAFPAVAQPRIAGETPNALAGTPAGTRWAYIICGHPGDEEHRKQFADSTGRIGKALTERFGFPGDNVWIRFGTDERRAGRREPPDDVAPPNEDQQSLESSRGPATKEALAADAEELQKLLRPQDELWVFVIGHAHHADRAVQLNLPGPDVGPGEFAGWFAAVPCRRSVFFVTTPLSGYFLKPLARQGRVVISATEPDLEVNATLFHSSLARLLETFPEGRDHDIDQDGVYSLLDLYLAVALDVAKRYADDNLLATEHAQLDDNGDGRGSELQLHYAPDENATAPPAARAAQIRTQQDGALAKSIDLGSIVRKASAQPAEP